ncbi:YozQ family protein [Peribacillus sp. SCS-155]|uniref:YozQ family protein n=1 Tax=Peribacillus sedimenti TaxID=3115297 RepID=UPI003906B7FD
MSKENKSKIDTSHIAGRTFHNEDYKKDDQLSSGLAETHEQVSDNYAGYPGDNNEEESSR